jgi:wyosine [tRNA(Phe)-imidazoG37] synthetase (radical SAM superfamily)
MAAVYGPVPSRRLGRSLGVDPIPFKTCNYSCVYCQLGRTAPRTVERRDFLAPEDILREVEEALNAARSGAIDYVTFGGQGEPLLSASLGGLIRGVKRLTSLPIALLTNGSLVSRRDVREEISAADVVMPSVDAADQETFSRINRPAAGVRIADILDGLKAFRRDYTGELWIEVMMVKGLNDSESAVRSIARETQQIRPERIFLNVPIRPPAESWVEPPDETSLRRAAEILGQTATTCEISGGDFELECGLPIVDAIIEILRRHPMAEGEVRQTVSRLAPGRTGEVIAALAHSEQVECRSRLGQIFWVYGRGRYAEGKSHDQRQLA